MPDDRQLTRNHFIGAFLLNMLKRNSDKYSDREHTYTARVTISIPANIRKRQGIHLNVTETRQFNKMVSGLLKKELHAHIDTYLYFDPRLNKAIDYARKKMGMDHDELSDDAITKDYQRYRDAHGGPRLYKNHRPVEIASA